MTSTTATRPQGLTGSARWVGVAALVAGLALTGCTSGTKGTSTVAATVPVVTVTRTAVPVTATSSTTSRPSTTTTSTPSPTTTTTTTAPDPSGIPWSQVGPGWSVVLTGTKPPTSPEAGDGTLSMVSPEGRRYALMGVGAYPRLQDVSPDGRRALGIDGSRRLVEWDLRARTTHVVPVLSLASPRARYARPSATRILVAGDQGARHRLLRLSLTGHVEASYETGFPAPPASSADGTRLVVSSPTGDTLQVLDNAAPRVVRTVTPPAGYEHCAPVRDWSGAEVEISCRASGTETASEPAKSDVFVLSTSTGSVRALTRSSREGGELIGYAQAWPVGSPVLAERATTCGDGPVGLLDGNGVIGTELTWPGTTEAPSVLGVVGTRAYAQVLTCNSGGVRLVSQDVLTHRVTTLATAPMLNALVVPNP